MKFRTLLSAFVIAAGAVAFSAGTALAVSPTDFSASVSCDSGASQAKITFKDTDHTSTKVFITVYAADSSTALAHDAIIPNAGFGDTISVEVPWVPDGNWTLDVTDAPAGGNQIGQLSLHAANVGCGTVPAPSASASASAPPATKPSPTNSATASASPSKQSVVPSPSASSALAETGASSGTGEEICIGFAVAILGTGAVLLARRRSAARHL